MAMVDITAIVRVPHANDRVQAFGVGIVLGTAYGSPSDIQIGTICSLRA